MHISFFPLVWLALNDLHLLTRLLKQNGQLAIFIHMVRIATHITPYLIEEHGKELVSFANMPSILFIGLAINNLMAKIIA